MIRRTLTVAACLLGITFATDAVEKPRSKATELAIELHDAGELEARRELLNTELPGLEIERVSLREAVDAIRDATKKNIFVNWRALEAKGVSRETRISISLDKIKLGRALELMFELALSGREKAGVTVDDGVITVSTAEDIAKNTLTRVYDVRAIVAGKAGERDQRKIKSLERLIQQTIDPTTWRDAGGNVGAIRELQGQIIVTQTPENQAALKTLIAGLTELVDPSGDK